MFIPAPAWLRERTLGEIELTASATAIEADAADSDTESTAAGQAPALPVDLVDDVRGRRTRRWMLVIALLAATVVASLGLTIAWQIQKNTVIAPTDLTGTAPQPISTAPSAAPSPTPSNPLPAPPTVPSTTPTASVPAGAGTPSGQTPAYIPPPLTFEPSPPRIGAVQSSYANRVGAARSTYTTVFVRADRVVTAADFTCAPSDCDHSDTASE